MIPRVDTVVVGGGQSGIVTSYLLTELGLSHVVLERGRIGEAWRSQRWDSFTLVTPNWMVGLPGAPSLPGGPDAFSTGRQLVELLEGYARSFQAPIVTGSLVSSVRRAPGADGFLVTTDSSSRHAGNVVVASGAFARPRYPSMRAAAPGWVSQLHSSEYRNPRRLAPGAVLVIGSGQSGCQIAEELQADGRTVYLSASGCGRIPRRYRGKDIMWWQNAIGSYDRIADQSTSSGSGPTCNPCVSGAAGGHSVDLRRLGALGVKLLGRLLSADGDRLRFAPDLGASLAKADAYAAEVTGSIDSYMASLESGASADDGVADGGAADAGVVNGGLVDGAAMNGPQWTITASVDVEEVDLRAASVSTLIWATGSDPDHAFVRLPVFDDCGRPVHQRGVTDVEGLYFLGLPWLHKKKSSLLLGIAEDARHVVSSIAARVASLL